MNLKLAIATYVSGIVALMLASQASANTVYVDPASSYQANGSTFSLSIMGNFSESTIGGGFTLSWDNNVISLVSDETAILNSLTANNFEFSNVQSITPTSLEVLSSSFVNTFTGVFNIVTLDFQAVQPGTTTAALTLSPTQTSDWVSGDLFSPVTVNYVGGTVEVGAVPVPAAVWLFGSGLIGLVGIARRGKPQLV